MTPEGLRIQAAICADDGVGFCRNGEHSYDCPASHTLHLIPAILSLIAEEREACAKIAESRAGIPRDFNVYKSPESIAAAIRARG